ncbi:MAG: hypothetical protein HS102_00585 [Planctomycetia bacterium]|nr:MAG: hypothetical protein F9K17_13465 [Phycisphaerae bacterium]MBE7455120.1 hypothetical protein [Planctomycetia bacterium]MCK6466487.1 hypothetical protein [Phycisphaerae bacterium]NUQ10674.1 hypothetical protein [Phycisphaerae bacterium]
MAADPFVHRVVPMAHVADVERSVRFYELLGFRVANRMRACGRTNWASLERGAASLMLAVASDPVKPEQQSILFYLYCNDVSAMRTHLLASGVADGGAFCGGPGPNGGRSVVFKATYPDYMPKGELRVADPDGYCLLIGQDD